MVRYLVEVTLASARKKIPETSSRHVPRLNGAESVGRKPCFQSQSVGTDCRLYQSLPDEQSLIRRRRRITMMRHHSTGRRAAAAKEGQSRGTGCLHHHSHPAQSFPIIIIPYFNQLDLIPAARYWNLLNCVDHQQQSKVMWFYIYTVVM